MSERHWYTMRIKEIAVIVSGKPQFRLEESSDPAAPVYRIFGQSEMEEAMNCINANNSSQRQIRTTDRASTLTSGDIVFSLIAGKAAIVQGSHNGCLYSHNYVKLTPTHEIDAGYLVYMLNENADINRQMHSGQQGSATMKHTVRQLSDLELPPPPPLTRQRAIGELYLKQLRLAALKRRVAATETAIIVKKLAEAGRP
jgi:hypothetical protein